MKASEVAQDLVWWAGDYRYALVGQLRGLFASGAKSYLSGDLRPIVILPGVWETWTFMVPLITRLHAAGHPVHVIPALHRNARPVVATAEILAGYLAEESLSDVVLVAHSKGGLIGKYAMTFLDPERRISWMAAVCSPFSGSKYAAFLVLRSLRAFSPRDATTVLLGQHTTANPRITSIFGRFDPHIPEGSALPGANNVLIASGGHFQILGDPTAIAAVLAVCAEPTPGCSHPTG